MPCLCWPMCKRRGRGREAREGECQDGIVFWPIFIFFTKMGKGADVFVRNTNCIRTGWSHSGKGQWIPCLVDEPYLKWMACNKEWMLASSVNSINCLSRIQTDTSCWQFRAIWHLFLFAGHFCCAARRYSFQTERLWCKFRPVHRLWERRQLKEPTRERWGRRRARSEAGPGV